MGANDYSSAYNNESIVEQAAKTTQSDSRRNDSLALGKEAVYLEKNKQTNIKIGGGKFYAFFKRTFDIVSSGLFLLIFGWLILVILLIKWAEDAGYPSYKLEIIPANENTKKEYTQYSKDGRKREVKIVPDYNAPKDSTVCGAVYTSIRIGKDGKPFKFHKIRSMCKGAEVMKEQLIAYDINEADDPAFKLKYDPRITRVGKFLRKTNLDEIIQIRDVFTSKLSVVGPRSPIGKFEVDNYTEHEKCRLKVKGGLLCLWQIQKNRHSISFEDWVELDIKYIENRSLWLDFKIIVVGFWRVLTSGE